MPPEHTGPSDRDIGKTPDRSDSPILADNPIQRPEDDLLGRASLARKFATQLRLIDASQGLVVGVLGPWGSGKTSFVHLVRSYLQSIEIEVVEFNPWMFSGAEQLLKSFFTELSAQLRLRAGLADVARAVAEYGEFFTDLGWVPVVGPWIERARMITKLVSKASKRRRQGIAHHRKRVETALFNRKERIVVLLDDLDRLTNSEIRDMFKLVRLTANFPNMVYIVAFDRTRVEQALEDQGLPGRDYLEKILQIAIDLPAVAETVMNERIFRSIEDVVYRIENHRRFDEHLWPDVYFEVIRPLIKNIRDVRRYALAAHSTLGDIGNQVAVVDVLGLEAIRVFLPDVFRGLHGCMDALTTTSGWDDYAPQASDESKHQIDKLIEAAGDQSGVVRSLVGRLFPSAHHHLGGPHYASDMGDEWLRERRVAHRHVLQAYLERVVGEGLRAFTEGESAMAVMGDRAALDGYLRSIDAERVQDVISSLEAYEEQFCHEHVVAGAVVLLNLLPDMPESRRGMLMIGKSVRVSRVVYRLVRSLDGPDQIEAATREILPYVTTLSSKLRLINIVGHRENVGHKLVSEPTALALEIEWRQEVKSTEEIALSKEWDLLRVLLVAKSETGDTEPDWSLSESPRITLALLSSARSETVSQSIDSRAVRRSPRLAWDVLVDLCGGERALRERIGTLKESRLDGSEELINLVEKYLSGWRPDAFQEDP